MANPFVPVKTSEGQAELSGRQRKLSQRHRTVLLLVDGVRSEPLVRTLAARAGAHENAFDELRSLGLIALGAPQAPSTSRLREEPTAPPVNFAHLIADALLADALDSMLPASRTLPPDSVLTDSTLSDVHLPDSVLQEFPFDAADGTDASLEEARAILVRAVRNEAPLVGALTLRRLRRARSREELAGLIHEVEARITKPSRQLATQQIVIRARRLLAEQVFSASAPA